MYTGRQVNYGNNGCGTLCTAWIFACDHEQCYLSLLEINRLLLLLLLLLSHRSEAKAKSKSRDQIAKATGHFKTDMT